MEEEPLPEKLTREDKEIKFEKNSKDAKKLKDEYQIISAASDSKANQQSNGENKLSKEVKAKKNPVQPERSQSSASEEDPSDEMNVNWTGSMQKMSLSGPRPGWAFCPQCEKLVRTRTSYQIGVCSWLAALCAYLGIFCLSFSCVFCPFFKDVVHLCPDCHTQLGIFIIILFIIFIYH